MRGRLLTLILLLCLGLSYGCEKKQEPSQAKTQPFSPVQSPVQAPMDKPMEQPRSPHSNASSKSEKKIIVPPETKNSWTAVKFIFEDRNTKKKSEYIAKLSSEMNIPGTEIKIVFAEFLPDFKMEKDVITTKGNEPNNPAVRVEIFEKGKRIFAGWLYAKYPEIHGFEHQRYGIILKEGIRG